MSFQTIVVSQNSRNMDGSPIIERACGHLHTTLSGAERCHRDLTKAGKDGMRRADFYHGEIRHSDATRLTDDENDQLANIERQRYS